MSRMKEVSVLSCSELVRTYLKGCAQFPCSSLGGIDRADGLFSKEGKC